MKLWYLSLATWGNNPNFPPSDPTSVHISTSPCLLITQWIISKLLSMVYSALPPPSLSPCHSSLCPTLWPCLVPCGCLNHALHPLCCVPPSLPSCPGWSLLLIPRALLWCHLHRQGFLSSCLRQGPSSVLAWQPVLILSSWLFRHIVIAHLTEHLLHMPVRSWGQDLLLSACYLERLACPTDKKSFWIADGQS